jgi:hypothetical protein
VNPARETARGGGVSYLPGLGAPDLAIALADPRRWCAPEQDTPRLEAAQQCSQTKA